MRKFTCLGGMDTFMGELVGTPPIPSRKITVKSLDDC